MILWQLLIQLSLYIYNITKHGIHAICTVESLSYIYIFSYRHVHFYFIYFVPSEIHFH